MSKTLLTLILTALCLFAVAVPVGAQTVDPLAATEEMIITHIKELGDFQEAYKSARGRYFQMLWTHTAVPDGTKLTVSDSLTLAPAYQTDLKTQDVLTVLKLDTSLPCRLRIDQYEGPEGLGYVFTAECNTGKQTLQRSFNFGPESYRDVAWVEVKPLK